MTYRHEEMGRKQLVVVLVGTVLLTAGCMDYKDHLVLNADGTGRYGAMVTLGRQFSMMMGAGGEGGTVLETNRAKVEQAVAEIEGATLRTWEADKDEQGCTRLRILIECESVDALLRSELAQSLGWHVRQKEGQLVVHQPAQWLRQGMGQQPGKQPMKLDDRAVLATFMPMLIGLKIERRVTLPNEVTETNADVWQGRTAAWIFEVTSETDPEDLLELPACSASCSMDGVALDIPAAKTE